MSQNTIQTKIEQVRNETQQYGNTRGRVADLLTMLNTEKLDRDGALALLAEISSIAPEFLEYVKAGNFVIDADAGFGGDLVVADDPAPTKPTWYFAKESGTYPNAGGLVVDLNNKLVILNYDGTTWSKVEVSAYQNITQNIANNTYNLDPGQIVPSEALYTDDTLAGDILKRVDKGTGENVNYRETTTWYDGTEINDVKLALSFNLVKKDGIKFLKSTSETFNVKMFGAKGDGVTDDKQAIQNAVDFCENTGIKQLHFPYGQYYISDSVICRRGGVDFIGAGALRREESWQNTWGKVNYPAVYTNETTFDQKTALTSTILVEKDKAAFTYSASVCEGFQHKCLGFRAKNGRTVGNTDAIRFNAEFYGPTWPVQFHDCHFSGFNKVLRISNTSKNYCIAFVDFTNCAGNQNDYIYYAEDTPEGLQTTEEQVISKRFMCWGLNFVGNKFHDNACIIRGAFSMDMVNIKQNNCEGATNFADGTTPKFSFDLDVYQCLVNFEGNHFEASSVGALKVFDYYRPSRAFVKINGNNINGMYTTDLFDFYGVYVKTDILVTDIRATACHIENSNNLNIKNSLQGDYPVSANFVKNVFASDNSANSIDLALPLATRTMVKIDDSFHQISKWMGANSKNCGIIFKVSNVDYATLVDCYLQNNAGINYAQEPLRCIAGDWFFVANSVLEGGYFYIKTLNGKAFVDNKVTWYFDEDNVKLLYY